jgi:hypothetical protein
MNRGILFLLCGLFIASAVWAEGGAFLYNDRGARDPFWPLVTSAGALINYETSFTISEMTLEGVVSDGRNGLAIINGAVVEVGKTIGQYVVQKIYSDRVILEKGGQTTELLLKKEE